MFTILHREVIDEILNICSFIKFVFISVQRQHGPLLLYPHLNEVERAESWFHFVHLSIYPSVHPSFHLWAELCPLCIVHNTSWIQFLLYPRPTKLEGGYTGFTLSIVCPSVRPSVCRWHSFRSISQVCFGISISNFICMLMVAISRSLLIFSDVTFEMAAWLPYWIFLFPDSNFSLALNINFKFQRHNTYIYG